MDDLTFFLVKIKRWPSEASPTGKQSSKNEVCRGNK